MAESTTQFNDGKERVAYDLMRQIYTFEKDTVNPDRDYFLNLMYECVLTVRGSMPPAYKARG